MSWEAWKQSNAAKLAHPAGFEMRFVELVLSHIPIVDPPDVIPQYEFVDDAGGRRRIDFMIRNDEKGYLLPIELDGFDKDKESRQWNDFLLRQNALVGSFGFVLRYSNAQMFNNHGSIVSEVTKFLSIQSSRKYAEAYIEAAIEGVAISTVAGVKTLETVSAIGIRRSAAAAAIDRHAPSRANVSARSSERPAPVARGRTRGRTLALCAGAVALFLAGLVTGTVVGADHVVTSVIVQAWRSLADRVAR